MRSRLTPLLIALLILVEFSVHAQSFYSVRRDRSLLLVAGTGTSTYLGELSNPGDYLDAKPNLNVGLQYFVAPRISFRGEVNWFQLSGDDAKADDIHRLERNLSFRSNNFEISFVGAVHLFPKGSRFYQRSILNPYAFLGLGYLYFNPSAELNGTRYALAPLQTEGVAYGRTAFVVPYGLGLKVKTGPFFNFVIEGGMRATFTDYLDDVSTVHPDKSTWTDPIRIALSDRRSEKDLQPYQPGARRGNPDSNDYYFLLNAKIEYFLPTNFLFKNNQRKAYTKRRKANRRRR